MWFRLSHQVSSKHIFVSADKQFKLTTLFSETIWYLGDMSLYLMSLWLSENENQIEQEREGRREEEGEEAPKKMVSEGEPIIIQLFQANQSIWFL